MLRLRDVVAAATVCVFGAAEAHDFWLDFPDYRGEPGASFTPAIFVGHAGDSDPWPMRRERIGSVRDFAPHEIADLQAGIVAGASGPGALRIALSGYGTHVVSLETTPAEIELDAAKFNEYLETEGLTPAIERRKAQSAEGKPGRELYSRRAKALIQIGDAPTENATKPIGQTLEIVPDGNPLALEAKEPLAVRVYYYGRPLAGASVHLESLSAGLVPEVTKITDADGRASFTFPHRGAWKFDVVWTEPIDHPRADFNTIFSSLTFGY